MDLREIKPIRFKDFLRGQIPQGMSEDQYLRSLSNERKQRLCELKMDLEEREKNFKILYFAPQEYQLPFFRSQKKLRLVTGSNQCGKTLCGVVEEIQLSLGIHPYRKLPVPNRGRTFATDLKNGIGEIIQKVYEEYAPRSEVKNTKRYPGGEMSKIFYRNGSTVDFRSYEQDPKLSEGWQGDWSHFDEPPPRPHYIATMRGLMRKKGFAWMTLTPLTEPWIYDDIFLQAGEGDDKPDVFNWDIAQNKYLSQEQVADFAARLSDDERDARLHGKFRHLSGLIYKNLNPAKHFIKAFDIPPQWPRYCSMDYHPRVHCAVVWIAFDPNGRGYIYDELWIDSTVKEISDVIKAKEGRDKIEARFIDSLSATPDRITGTSPQREFIRHGLGFRSATKAWIAGKNAVSEYLGLDAEGQPGLYFLVDRVPRCANAFGRYQWDEYSSLREGEKEQPKKQYAHFPDAVRYILVMRPSGRRPDDSAAYAEERKAHKYTGYRYGG